MRFPPYKTGEVIRFPVEQSGKPLDAIEAFRRKHRKEKATSVEISEPEFLKNISDTKVIENIIVKEHSAWYQQTGAGNITSDKPATFRLMRRTLMEPDSVLAESRIDFDIIRSYIDFLINEFINKFDQHDLLSRAELYKYAAKINEKVSQKKFGLRSTIRGESAMPSFEIYSQLHYLAGKLYEILSKKTEVSDKKTDLAHEAISEYLAQILVYELKKELSQEEFDLRIKFIARQDMKDNITKELVNTMESYDSYIKVLTGKVLKLSKIKS